MKKIFKKTGSVLFCLLPFLLVFTLQFAISVSAYIIQSVLLIARHPEFLSDFDRYQSVFYQSITGDFTILVSIIYAVTAALIMGFWYWKKFAPKKSPRRSIRQIINLKMFLALLALMIGLQYLSTYIVSLTAFIHPAWYETYEQIMINVGFTEVSFLLIFYTVIIAPISEELIFRGVTMHYARKIMPFWVANIFQALLFGIFHQNMIQGTYAFAIGLFCGYVCRRGGSIYLSILFHMLFNLWGVFTPGNLYYNGSLAIIHLLLFLLTIGITTLGFYLYHAGVKSRDTAETVMQ